MVAQWYMTRPQSQKSSRNKETTRPGDWLFAGAPFCCVVVQVAGVQVAIFHMADFFLITC